MRISDLSSDVCSSDLVMAVDRSSEMLRFARVKLPEEGSGKYELLLGDFYALPLQDGASDTVIIHQVLHYAQQPELVIREAARVLDSHGRLLIADFAPHERRSEEHTSELQSLMRITYAVFCLKKKTIKKT